MSLSEYLRRRYEVFGPAALVYGRIDELGSGIRFVIGHASTSIRDMAGIALGIWQRFFNPDKIITARLALIKNGRIASYQNNLEYSFFCFTLLHKYNTFIENCIKFRGSSAFVRSNKYYV